MPTDQEVAREVIKAIANWANVANELLYRMRSELGPINPKAHKTAQELDDVIYRIRENARDTVKLLGAE